MIGGSQWGLGGDCDPQGEVRHDEVQSVISAGWHCHMLFQTVEDAHVLSILSGYCSSCAVQPLPVVDVEVPSKYDPGSFGASSVHY